ncbi:UNVERIFIED_CONTAM: hypothetical protein Sangu_1976400 [Sesamum angustifolium]|uniref:DUF4216 domain-containing protein n=1 Tax=Sesamum angustifolium TaxID=2727405 RepID=A0AAW2LZG3_9LAMI
MMPKGVYTVSKEQKRKIGEWITHIKFSYGYVSNLARCVNIKELRLHGMKSYDCHVFMSKLIPIALCEMLLESVWSGLTEVSLLFQILCSTMLDVNKVKSNFNYTDNELWKLHYWVPTTEVPTFTCYLVNDYNFHTERHSVGKSTMSYGVCVKNSSYTNTDSDFYGILEEIIQLDYPLIPNMHITLFKCRWVDPVRGMKVHPCYQLVDVNFKKVYQKNETFILEQQAVQVYYTTYPIMKRDKGDWMTICKTKARRVIDDSRWTEVAFQEDKTIPSPQVVTDNHNYELHGPNYIQLVVELSIANQQGAGTSGSAQCESGDKSDKDNFDENYETEEDNNYD